MNEPKEYITNLDEYVKFTTSKLGIIKNLTDALFVYLTCDYTQKIDIVLRDRKEYTNALPEAMVRANDKLEVLKNQLEVFEGIVEKGGEQAAMMKLIIPQTEEFIKNQEQVISDIQKVMEENEGRE